MMYYTINFCKLFFILLTIFMVIFGSLINIFEQYLPLFITNTFRYGKFSSQQQLEIIKYCQVPKSYFKHFYKFAAFLFYPIVLYQVILVYYFEKPASTWFLQILNISCGYNRQASVETTQIIIALFLLMLQIYRRYYDTHYVSVFSKKAVMNLVHYIIGILHYPALLLIILSEAPNFTNNTEIITYKNLTIIDFFAIFLFVWSWYHQYICNKILGDLRKDKGVVINDNYRIPTGDWFDYLSSPHSTAEILMYTALTLLLYKNTGWLCVYFWVLSNQVETILLSHWWYQSNFKNFPKQRKALIPFIY